MYFFFLCGGGTFLQRPSSPKRERRERDAPLPIPRGFKVGVGKVKF